MVNKFHRIEKYDVVIVEGRPYLAATYVKRKERERERNWKRIFNGSDEGPILVKRKPQRNAAMCTRVNRIRLIYRPVPAFPSMSVAVNRNGGRRIRDYIGSGI